MTPTITTTTSLKLDSAEKIQSTQAMLVPALKRFTLNLKCKFQTKKGYYNLTFGDSG